MKLALMFKNGAKLQLSSIGLSDNTLGGVAGQCLLRSLHDYVATAATAVAVETQHCSTGSLEP